MADLSDLETDDELQEWYDELVEHGEVEIITDAGAVYELHLDIDIETDDNGVPQKVGFENPDGEYITFDADAVESHDTHPSHRVSGP